MPYHIPATRCYLATALVFALFSSACAAPLAGSASKASETPTSAASTSGAISSIPAGSIPAESTVSGAEPDPGPWSAVVESGPPGGIPSPGGELSAELAGDRVCFRPTGGADRCGSLATGKAAIFAAFSPDGDRMLVVAGPASAAAVYVFDAPDARARILGPQGVQNGSADPALSAWDLSTATWGADGSVLLLPRTEGASGPVFGFDLSSGAISRRAELDAALVNGWPSLWSTPTGLAVVANTGDTRDTAWWVDEVTGRVREIARLADPGGSLVLSTADPLGRTVLVCPKRADGRLGATTRVAVERTDSQRLLPDSLSCAGAVYSADGAHLALTADVDGKYLLIVVEVASGNRVLTVPLPVPAPAVPPYLTWSGDVVVAVDVSGGWPFPSVIAHLQR